MKYLHMWQTLEYLGQTPDPSGWSRHLPGWPTPSMVWWRGGGKRGMGWWRGREWCWALSLFVKCVLIVMLSSCALIMPSSYVPIIKWSSHLVCFLSSCIVVPCMCRVHFGEMVVILVVVLVIWAVMVVIGIGHLTALCFCLLWLWLCVSCSFVHACDYSQSQVFNSQSLHYFL